ncbi:hypothetical protein [Methylobacterium iners]|uniref:Uncharacterized protein n=1 Tax=Methylobacterium iners TaxID=418707 RepID=A0ABQ4S765_9HYPH|nr:hypothetical protein [Methylobacterium iners]GJD97638.1 hypothetical protein OCOJLMKI_4871 [Methylobacterium iners]
MQQIETTLEHLGPTAAATLQPCAVSPFEALIAPGDVFRRPHEVLTHPGLSVPEKRAILASWASDARSVESDPALRCLSGSKAEPVPVDEVLDALLALDDEKLLWTRTEAPKQHSRAAFGVRWPRSPASKKHSIN